MFFLGIMKKADIFLLFNEERITVKSTSQYYK